MGLFSRKKYPSKKSNLDDNNSGEYLTIQGKENNEKKLQATGLRGTKLTVVVACIIILWIVSIGTFVCNVIILLVLRMNHKGMDSIQFYRSASGQPVVRFTGKDTHFDSVVPKSGLISSAGNTKFEIQGSKIRLVNRKGGAKVEEPGFPPLSINMDDDHIKMEGVKEFYVADARTSNSIFEASKPKLKFDKTIRMISANSIKATKVRAPIDEHLSLDVETLVFSGNEGNFFSGRNIFLRALNNVTVKTINERGSMTFKAAKGVRLSIPGLMKVSSSPKIEADRLGKRLCACEDTGKLFVVPGNKPCAINPAYCY